MEREKRMVSKTVTDTDKFLDMPLSAQALYFHLIMRADDEGFIDSPNMVCRIVAGADDDIFILEKNGFIVVFDSGVIAIRHWKIHNRLSKIVPTEHKEERQCLDVDKLGVYREITEE